MPSALIAIQKRTYLVHHVFSRFRMIPGPWQALMSNFDAFSLHRLPIHSLIVLILFVVVAGVQHEYERIVREV
jgi:uncharacterized membrane protein